MQSASHEEGGVTLRIHRDRRVEVDPPDDPLAAPAPPPNTPWLYLRDATRALRDCGNAAILYGGWRGEDGHPPNAGFAYLRGPERRTEQARTSILFSAFAAEAYVNAFLAKLMAGKEFALIERDAPREKFFVHVPRVSRAVRFEAGRQPGQVLAKLFTTRNWLVHPQPGVASKHSITPQLAAESLVAVAEAARQMTAELGNIDARALAVAKERKMFVEWGELCAARIPELDEAEPPDLFLLAVNRQLGPQLNEHMRRHRAR